MTNKQSSSSPAFAFLPLARASRTASSVLPARTILQFSSKYVVCQIRVVEFGSKVFFTTSNLSSNRTVTSSNLTFHVLGSTSSMGSYLARRITRNQLSGGTLNTFSYRRLDASTT
jgi:hypothetical protein